MIVGVLQVDLHLPLAHSLKEKRSVIKSLKDQLRGRFNISIAELDVNDKWQRATVGISALGQDRGYVEGLLREVTEWIRQTRLVNLVRVDEQYL